jgi:hypothetical protein
LIFRPDPGVLAAAIGIMVRHFPTSWKTVGGSSSRKSAALHDTFWVSRRFAAVLSAH